MSCNASEKFSQKRKLMSTMMIVQIPSMSCNASEKFSQKRKLMSTMMIVQIPVSLKSEKNNG
jgi:hypothetical protein